MTHDVFLTNPDGPTAQEITRRSIDQQAKALKIEQDCCLMDYARATKSQAMAGRIMQRFRHQLQEKRVDDATWHAAMQDMEGMLDHSKRETERILTTAKKAEDLGIRRAKLQRIYLDARKAGREEADLMSTSEVSRAILDMQS